MPNLTRNDALETGMEINDVSTEVSAKWEPLTLKSSWPLIKEYCKRNFTLWKVFMTIIAIIVVIISLYLATFAGQMKSAMSKFGKKIGKLYSCGMKKSNCFISKM